MMDDDWATFSRSPYEQRQQTQEQPGMTPEGMVAVLMSPALLLDWPDAAHVVLNLMTLGKKVIWIDLLDAINSGMSGKEIQDRLRSQGIEIHARLAQPIAETIGACIVVDIEKEAKARSLLAKMGVSLL